jgi:hypothetical protein
MIVNDTLLPPLDAPRDAVPPDPRDADGWTSDAAVRDIFADPGAPPEPDASPRDADGSLPDADATLVDAADAARVDVNDAGAPLGPQILPRHGTPIQKPDAGGPFDSRCAADEVVTGFNARAGVQTDAIGAICRKLVAGSLGATRSLPLNGTPTGGNAVTVTCPTNHVAAGVVGRYGHNTAYDEDVTTAVGLVCRDLTSANTQIVAITTQPALDPGYTSFREDCTSTRVLTSISGVVDSNSLSVCVPQVGGECNVR